MRAVTMHEDELLRHSAWIRRLALELVGDGHVADDLVQDTWLAYLDRRPDRDRPLRPWLARVLRNRAALAHRGRLRRTDREARVARVDHVEPEQDLVERAEIGRRLVGLVLELPEPYRTTLLLRFQEDLSPAQIAQRRDLPPATVRSHLHRGLERLRERLDGDHGGDRRSWGLALLPLARRAVDSLPAAGGASTTAGVAALGAGLGSAAVLAGVALALFLGWVGLRFGAPAPHAPSLVPRDGVRLAGTGPGATLESGLAPGSPVGASGLERVPGAVAAAPTPRVRLLADLDRRPLAGIALELPGGTLRTDEHGELALPLGAAAPRATWWTDQALETVTRHGVRLRAPRPGLERALEPDDSGVVLVPAGPGFELTLHGPPVGSAGRRPERLEARLRSLHPGGYRDDGRPWALAPLRAGEGEGLRVDFAPLPEPPAEAVAWQLEVRDSEGLWAGSVPLPPARVPASGAHAVEVRPLAALLVRVEEDGGRGPQAFHLRLADGEIVPLEPVADGEWRGRWLPAGEHELVLESSAHAPWSRVVSLAVGTVTDVAPRLEPRAIAGDLEGRVTCASGGEAGQLLLLLLDERERLLDLVAPDWRAEDGLSAARFRFRDVPAGPCTVQVVSLSGVPMVSGDRVDVRAPRQGLELRIEDQVPRTDWEVVALDPEGRALESFLLEVDLGPGLPLRFHRTPQEQPWAFELGGSRWNRFGGDAPLRDLASDARLDWSWRADGQLPLQGDESDFETLPDGRRRLILRPRPE